jgi:hypothetical protein
LELRVLLLIPGIHQLLKVFIVRYAQQNGRRDTGTFDEEALVLVGHLVEDLSEVVAQIDSGDLLRGGKFRLFQQVSSMKVFKSTTEW